MFTTNGSPFTGTIRTISCRPRARLNTRRGVLSHPISRSPTTMSSTSFVRPSANMIGVPFAWQPVASTASWRLYSTQPAKMAAFEALWQTRPGAPLTLFAIPRPDRERNSFYVGLPRALSLLVFGDANATVTGLDRIAPPDRPPLLLTFFSYRLMVLLGCLFVVLAGASLTWGLWRKVPFPPCWLRLLTLAAPLGYVACEAGWVAAEVGRQPWAVYGILRTRDAISRTVPAWQVLASLIAFTLLYALLLWVFLRILLRIVRQGPEAPERAGY